MYSSLTDIFTVKCSLGIPLLSLSAHITLAYSLENDVIIHLFICVDKERFFTMKSYHTDRT